MTEVTMTSHMMPASTSLFHKNEAELLIVSPPRSGSAFMLTNLRGCLERLDGIRNEDRDEETSGYNKIVATRFLSELDQTKNIISIVRKPSDWIASLVTARLFLEARTDVSALLDEEIAAAEVALQTYKDFDSDKIMFVKFEDVAFRLFRTVRKISETFNYPTREPFDSAKMAKDSPLSPATSKRFPSYPGVATELATKDLSVVDSLYQDLLAKTVTV